MSGGWYGIIIPPKEAKVSMREKQLIRMLKDRLLSDELILQIMEEERNDPVKHTSKEIFTKYNLPIRLTAEMKASKIEREQLLKAIKEEDEKDIEIVRVDEKRRRPTINYRKNLAKSLTELWKKRTERNKQVAVVEKNKPKVKSKPKKLSIIVKVPRQPQSTFDISEHVVTLPVSQKKQLLIEAPPVPAKLPVVVAKPTKKVSFLPSGKKVKDLTPAERTEYMRLAKQRSRAKGKK